MIMSKTAEELEKELNDLRAQTENLVNSKKRVEEENAKYKSRAKDAEEKLSDAEKEKLISENKVHELLKIEREEKEKLLEKYDGMTSKTLKEKLRTEVSKFAKDAHDVDDILRVVEAKEALKIDRDNLLVDGVEDFVTKVRELKPHLFAKNKINSNEDLPPNKQNTKDLTSDEKYQKELKGAKSQKEFDNIRAKHGKL